MERKNKTYISKLIIESIEQKKYKDIINNNCCICGIEKANYFENRNKVLSTSFTDYSFMVNKDSQYICDYCQKLLNNNYLNSPKGKTCGLRLYSFLIENNNFYIIDMKQKIDYLFNYKFKIPFLLCFSKTGKKHIFLKSKLSYNYDKFWVCTEENNIYFERNKYLQIYQIVNNFFQLGVSKNELKTCIIDPKKINKFKLNLNDLIIIKKYKNNQCYELIIDCLIRDKKND
jgi:hypothetical protein